MKPRLFNSGTALGGSGCFLSLLAFHLVCFFPTFAIPGPSSPSLEDLLDKNGRISSVALRKCDYEGSLDVSGYSVEVASEDGPRFSSRFSLDPLTVAGDESWWSGFGGSQLSDEVLAIGIYGGDLVVGGFFFTAGGIPGTFRIARWDGTQWQPMGTVINSNVRAFAVYHGELIAGGDFLSAGGGAPTSKIARWNGSTWLPVGPVGVGANNNVYSLCVKGDSLIIGGQFTTIAGISANRIAWWDGTTMHPFGSGFTDIVYAVTEWNGSVVAGGNFSGSGASSVFRLGVWDGATWSHLGPGGMSNAVRALTVHEGNLIAGGDFLTAGGVTVNRIAAWDSVTWSPFGSGVDARVTSLCSTPGGLYAGGQFSSADGVSVSRIARWDGAQLDDVGGGMIHDDYSSWVNKLFESDGVVYAAGYFTEAGGVEAIHMAGWDGNSWSSPMSNTGNGLYGSIGPRTMTVFNGELILGGAFTRAAGQRVNYIARWNGLYFSTFGNGMAGGVLATLVHNGRLYAGGFFTTADGVPANYVAEWDGVEWRALGTGTNGPVQALGSWNGGLYVGGNFTTAGGVVVNNVARWDGTTFSPLGSGVSGEFNGVFSFGEYDNKLIVGGDFTLAGGISAKAIARWDGNAWGAMGSGMTGGVQEPTVQAITIYNNDLIAAGYFLNVDGEAAKNVARWDGASWHPLGAGISTITYDLCVYNQKLIAGGFFTVAGGTTVNRIAAWDGSSWSSLGSGMQNWVDALAVYQGSLYAGGLFDYAGLKSSLSIARWTDPASSVPEPPRVSTLIASPNPFSAGTTITFTAPDRGAYRVTLYDVQGRRLKTLIDGLTEPGEIQVKWDGRDESGEEVPPGVYFVRVSGPTELEPLKIVRIP